MHTQTHTERQSHTHHLNDQVDLG